MTSAFRATTACLYCAAVLLGPAMGATVDEPHPQHAHSHDATPEQPAASGTHRTRDTRQAVVFPARLKTHTLANMRDHLKTLGDIERSLAEGDAERAAHLAEHKLGLSSLDEHGAHDVARYMPAGMQQLGAAMHRSASQFALAAQDASATGDLKAALLALSRVHDSCVACHAAYRLR